VEHPLEAIDWRIERADKHLATLNGERDAFLDEKNCRIIGHFDRDTSEYVFRFAGKLPDPRLGLLVGEFAHHLRSALDNLLWQLVLLRGGSPTTKTQFPIYESRERYQASLWMLRGVSADDRAAIEAVQPFQLGDRAADSYPSLLAWLNNVDKHRFVHVGGIVPRRFPIPVFLVSKPFDTEGEPAGEFPWQFAAVRDVGKILSFAYVTPGASDDRAELLRVRIEPSGPDPQMQVQGDPPIEIAVSDVDGTPVYLSHLAELRAFVVVIIEHLRPRFNEVGRVP
jgi:hypothetical protein